MKINTSMIALALAATMGFAGAPTLSFAQTANDPATVVDDATVNPNLEEQCIENEANESLATQDNEETERADANNDSGDTASECPESTEVAPRAEDAAGTVTTEGGADAAVTTEGGTVEGGADAGATTTTETGAEDPATVVDDAAVNPDLEEQCIDNEANESLATQDNDDTERSDASNDSGDTASECPESTEVAPRAQ